MFSLQRNEAYTATRKKWENSWFKIHKYHVGMHVIINCFTWYLPLAKEFLKGKATKLVLSFKLPGPFIPLKLQQFSLKRRREIRNKTPHFNFLCACFNAVSFGMAAKWAILFSHTSWILIVPACIQITWLFGGGVIFFSWLFWYKHF